MASAKELIEFLQKLPPNTEIEVLQSYDYNYSSLTKEVPLDLTEYSGNFDIYNETEDRNYKILVLGEN